MEKLSNPKDIQFTSDDDCTIHLLHETSTYEVSNEKLGYEELNR